MRKVHDNPIYLDYASTSPLHPEVLKDITRIQTEYFENADSLHFGGQRVSDLVSKSTQALATMLHVLPHEIIYTSGASESNSTAVKGIALGNQDRGKHIITTLGEHASVDNAVKQLVDYFGYTVTYLPLKENGSISLNDLRNALQSDTVLVSMIHINNETGAVNDIEEAAHIIKKHSKAFFHVDAVQGLARHPFEMKQIDAVSYSAHKISGVKGSGLLVMRASVDFLPLINGGQQQHGHRGGTLNTPAVIVFAKTLRLASQAHNESINDIIAMNKSIYDYFEGVEGVEFNSTQEGSPYIINMSFANVGSEIMINGLNAKGIYLSGQSTCNSKSLEASHVLLAMGKSEAMAKNSVRISLSHHTKQEEIDIVLETMMEIKNYVQHGI